MGVATSAEGSPFTAEAKVSLSFLIGAGIGAAVSYYLTKRYYSKKADEGVAEVLERFGTTRPVKEEVKEAKERPKDILNPPIVEKGPSEWPVGDDTPYPIKMAVYTDDEEYDKEDGLVYYEGDGVLTDKYDHVLDEVGIFGDHFEELRKHFGDDEPDILYLRNPGMKTDYEICLEHCSSPDYVLREGDLDD